MSKVTTNILYIGLYSIANIFILLNYDGLYWDDWVAYNQDGQTMAVFFDMLQHNIKGDFFLILEKHFNHIYAFRLFIYFSYLFIGYFIYRILISTEIFNDNTSKFIAFLSILIPVNSVKIYISIAPFVFPMLLFYLAFFLLSRNYPLQSKSLKVIILTIFFFSFSTNSILVFYASVLLYLYYMDNSLVVIIKPKVIKKFVLERWDFIILPILYFLYKSIYLVPYGVYHNYNSIDFSFEQILNVLLRSFKYMTIDLFQSLLVSNYLIISAVIVSVGITLLFNNNFKLDLKKSLSLFILSIVLYVFAVFPYAAVNKTPVLSGNNGRFALLLGPAIAMLFIAISSFISHLFFEYKQKVFLFLASFLVIIMGAKNMSQQYEFIVDNFYQAAMIENFKDEVDIREYTTFVVHPYKVRSFYEWNGILKKAFGNTKRVMISPSMIKRLDPEGRANKSSPLVYLHEFSVYKQYNFDQWNGNQSYKDVYIKKDMVMTPYIKAKLTFYYLFDYNKFKVLVKNLVSVNVK